MTEEEEHTSSRGSAFDHLNRVGIGHLSPDIDSVAGFFIDGDVALIWPFSSATGELSILLADPDVRLRKSKGQVKVTFRNACAREVAASRLGIGDNVRLSLEGAEWVDTGDAVSTPGKKVEWDLRYATRAILDISRGSIQLAFIDFEQKARHEIRDGVNGVSEEFVTPYTPRINGTRFSPLPLSLSSPVFFVSKRHSAGSFIDASLGPFAEDDGFVVGKGRKRTKFARHSGTWELSDDNGSDEEIIDLSRQKDSGEDLHVAEVLSESSRAEPPSLVAVFQELQLPIQTNGHSHPGRIQSSQASSSPQRELADVEVIETVNPEKSQEEATEASEEELENSEREETEETKNKAEEESETVVADALGSKSILSSDRVAMALPNTPLRHRPPLRTIQPEDRGAEKNYISESQATTTPRLRPLPSPALPLVSPLTQCPGVVSDYFPDFATASSELEASDTQVRERFSTVCHPEYSHFQLAMPFPSPGLQTNFDLRSSSTNQSESEDKLVRLQLSLESAHTGLDEPAAGSNYLPLVSSRSTVKMDAELEEHETHEPATNDWTESFPEADSPTGVFGSGPEVIEDEDMYGSSEPRMNVDRAKITTANLKPEVPPTLTEQYPLPQISEQLPSSSPPEPTDWQEELDISRTDSETRQFISSQPVTFRQSWERSSIKSMRSSTYPQSFDGASDHLDEDENRSHSSGHEQTSDLPNIASGLTEDMPPFEGKTQSSHGDEDELQKPVLNSSVSSEDPTRNAIVDQEVPEIVSADGEAVERATETVTKQLDLRQKIPRRGEHLLLTPANTQPELLEVADIPIVMPQPEQKIPPTPQKTQEQIESQLKEVSPEAEEAVMAERVIEESAPAAIPPPSPIRRRTSQRLSRKSLPSENLASLSSPYFMPRRSARMNSQLLSSSTRKENVPLPDQAPAPPSPQEAKHLDAEELPDAGQKIPEGTLFSMLESRPSGLVTPLSYFTPLTSISDHFFQIVDVLAICPKASTEPQRAKLGPKDFYCTLQLTDSSLEGDDVVLTQIFRTSKFALPITKRGDVILLRNVKVQSQKRKCFLLSTDSSAWAVFSYSVHAYSSASLLGAKSAGPPIEYGPEECSRAFELMQWWDEYASKRFPLPNGGPKFQVKNSMDGGSEPAPATKRVPETQSLNGDLRNISTAEAQSGTLVQELVGKRSGNRRRANLTDHFGNGKEDEQPISPQLPPPPTSRRRSDASHILQQPPRAGRGHRRDRKSESVIHELRDGTKYEDKPQPSSPHTRRSRRSESVVHELRDGTTGTDEQQPSSPHTRRSQRGESLVHELRDGTTWVYEESLRPLTSRRGRRSESVVHELRDGATYVDE